jgi:hypothetical protein
LWFWFVDRKQWHQPAKVLNLETPHYPAELSNTRVCQNPLTRKRYQNWYPLN